MQTQGAQEGKTMAIISYLTAIGLIISYVNNSEKKNSLVAYHIRQSLGIILLFIIVSIFLSAINFLVSIPFLGWILQLGTFVLWLLGILSAGKGLKEPVPLFGAYFQEWFKGI
ncbi:DUF4870 domain-containing protein [Jejudonia soesokkakensis]|uniref:DUF4870 domain-containing protein n=1 Tax=Jejudonia soesokkakensis TaxID=1323432 RepID=A0ABW2MQ50_9FLAO